MTRRGPVLLALGLFLLGGCASGTKSKLLSGTTRGWYSVTAAQTPFYRYGPQQGNGPDQQLSKGSLMKVIRPSFGYVKVQLQGGLDGYVASEDIRPASLALVAEKLAPQPIVAVQSTLHLPEIEQFQLNTSDPRLIAPPEPLPDSGPEPTPIPDPSGPPSAP